MVKVNVNEADGFYEIKLEGHAINPLVCSAISAITDTFILGLQGVEEIHPEEIKVKIREV